MKTPSRYLETLQLSDSKFWSVFAGEQAPLSFLAEVDELIQDGEFSSREEAFIDYVESKIPDDPEIKLLANRLLRIAENYDE